MPSRAYDWVNTPPETLLSCKDLLAFICRLDFYAGAEPGGTPRQPGRGYRFSREMCARAAMRMIGVKILNDWCGRR